MKVIIEPSDVERGAEFVSNIGQRYVVVHNVSGVNALINLTAARVVTSEAGNEATAATLGHVNAVPLWLHEARQQELKRLAALTDD